MCNKRKYFKITVLYLGGSLVIAIILVIVLLQLDSQSCRFAFIMQTIVGKKPVPPPRFTGVWQAWFKNGRLASEYTYKDGRRTGEFTTWYSNGQKASSITLLKCVPYDDAPGAFENTYTRHHIEWFKDGKLAQRENISNGKLHGRFECWDNPKEGYWKRKDMNYKNGKRHGLCIRWSMRGVRTETTYKDGKMHGWSKQVSEETGELNWEEYREYDKCKIYRRYHHGKLFEERRLGEIIDKELLAKTLCR